MSTLGKSPSIIRAETTRGFATHRKAVKARLVSNALVNAKRGVYQF
jgi:hypothetical protein